MRMKHWKLQRRTGEAACEIENVHSRHDLQRWQSRYYNELKEAKDQSVDSDTQQSFRHQTDHTGNQKSIETKITHKKNTRRKRKQVELLSTIILPFTIQADQFLSRSEETVPIACKKSFAHILCSDSNGNLVLNAMEKPMPDAERTLCTGATFCLNKSSFGENKCQQAILYRIGKNRQA